MDCEEISPSNNEIKNYLLLKFKYGKENTEEDLKIYTKAVDNVITNDWKFNGSRRLFYVYGLEKIDAMKIDELYQAKKNQ